MQARKDITISVIIPAYNAEKYISRAIESVLTQTSPADEIVVVDDGSTDGTSEIIKSYGDKVQYINQKNAGASAARNTGIKTANCEWIAFLDCDDEWLPEKLELQRNLLKKNPNLKWVTGNYYMLDSQTNNKTLALEKNALSTISDALEGKDYFSDFFKAYLVRGHGHTNTMLIKRKLLIEAGLFDVNLPRVNDYDMWLRIGYLKEPLGFVHDATAIYYTNISTSIVSTYLEEKHFDVFLSKHLELSKMHGFRNEFIPCATLMLKWWIGRLIKLNNGSGARKLLKKYSFMLNDYFYKTAMISSYFTVLANAYNNMTGGGFLGDIVKNIKSGKKI